jgi:hypothetical protein
MTTARTIAIAQPTFLPWAGYFDIADQVDLLVVLDDVGFSKQSWQQRNRIRTPEGLGYVTAPVRTAGRLGQSIMDTELADTKFVEKVTRTISQNYRRAAYYARYFDEFAQVFKESAATGNLCALNRGLIEWLTRQLGVGTPRVLSSTLNVTGKRGEYVAKLCAEVGARRYLSPPGAEEYLIEDRAEFESRSVSVALHVYEHPEYRQCYAPFVPYASVIDLLFNEGDAALGIIRSGRRPPRALATGVCKE